VSVGLYSGVSGLALGTGLYKNVSGLWSGASGLIDDFGGGSPFSGASLYLNFLAGAPLDSRITFSRGSNATLVDSTGKITYAPANLVLQSQTFDDAGWTKLNATVTANTTVAPDGTSTADTLSDGTATDNHGVRPTTLTLANSTTYTMSVYAKFSSLRYIIIDLVATSTSTTYSAVSFDIQTGVVANSAASGTGYAVVASSIQDVGNGWYRCAATLTIGSTGTALQAYIGTSSTGVIGNFGLQNYTGTNQTAFIWGAQLEPVTYQTTPSTYVATTANAYYGPRFDYDPVTLAPKGLLIEEQRTNLVLQSQTFDDAAWTKSGATVTANATISPDGTSNADKLAETSANAPHYAIQTVTVAAVAHTASVYVKAAERTWCILEMGGTPFGCGAWFNLSTGVVGTQFGSPTSVSITAAGNGWWRITMNKTAASAGSAFTTLYTATGDNVSTYAGTTGSGIFLYGAQLEAGSFATSYIPTVASTVTRSADNAEMIGTNFSSWYNQSEGTFVSDFDKYSVASRGGVLCAGNTLAATGTDIAIDGQNDAKVRMFIENAGAVEMLNATLATYAANTPIKAAAAYATNNAVGAAAGALGTVDTSVVVPTLNALQIGGLRNSSAAPQAPLNGHIRQIAYYNTRLPNTQLQTLTAPSLATTLSLSFTNQAYTVGV
jgi:hypothetical protein